VPRARRHALVGWLAIAVLGLSAAWAHEIPTDVAIQIIAKPSGDHLDLLVRVPLEAMQDIEFPTIEPGYLDIARADRALRDSATLWLADDIEIYEDDRRLDRPRLVAARASIPSDRSFTAYESALAHMESPRLPTGIELPWRQALLDVQFTVPIRSERSAFSIRPALERLGLRVVTVVRYVAPGGAERIFEIAGDAGRVELDPRWHQAALRFVEQGFLHILDGVDHLLFLLCLVVPFRRDLRALVLIVTAFTVAHSITLIASAYGLAPDVLWFPPLVETLIAASIFYMAIENVVAANVRTRWAIAFGFGLVHGFGFSFALRNTLQFAGDHVLMSLLSFNIGVELGQLLVLVLLVPLLDVVFRYVVQERLGVIILSVIVAHTAWHWMADRFAVLREFRLGWSDFHAAFVGSGLRWLALGLVIAVLTWLIARQLRIATIAKRNN
jgi:HupE / UreJ protein